MPSDANIMEIRNDFKELLELFNNHKHKVEYVIVSRGSFPLSTGLRRGHLDLSPVFGELFALHS